MLALVGMLIPLFVPFILAAMIITTKSKTRLEWIFAVWFTFAFSLFYYLTGGWFLLSYALRYVSAGLVLVAMVISFLRMPKTTAFANLSQPGYKFKLATYLVPSMIFTVLSIVALWGGGLFRAGSNPSISSQGRNILYCPGGRNHPG